MPRYFARSPISIFKAIQLMDGPQMDHHGKDRKDNKDKRDKKSIIFNKCLSYYFILVLVPSVLVVLSVLSVALSSLYRNTDAGSSRRTRRRLTIAEAMTIKAAARAVPPTICPAMPFPARRPRLSSVPPVIPRRAPPIPPQIM